jgi:putative ABC transport system ATP-binding protein
VGERDFVRADVPSANLDHATGESILGLMGDINRRVNTTFIFSTHDRKVMSKADRLVWLEDGELKTFGLRTPEKWILVNNRHAKARAPHEQPAKGLAAAS